MGLIGLVLGCASSSRQLPRAREPQLRPPARRQPPLSALLASAWVGRLLWFDRPPCAPRSAFLPLRSAWVGRLLWLDRPPLQSNFKYRPVWPPGHHSGGILCRVQAHGTTSPPHRTAASAPVSGPSEPAQPLPSKRYEQSTTLPSSATNGTAVLELAHSGLDADCIP